MGGFFEFGPGFFDLIQILQSQAPIEIGFRVFGIDLGRELEFRDGVLVPACLDEGGSPVVESFSVSRINYQRVSELFDGLRVFPNFR